MANIVGLMEFEVVGVVDVRGHELAPRMSIIVLVHSFQVLGPDIDEDGPQGGNSKMTSPSNTGGRNGTVSCFTVLRSIVDNSFRKRCILASLLRHSMMLAFASTCVCIRGIESEELECLPDGIVDRDFTMSACPDAVRTEQLWFCPLTLEDSLSDLLDNSIIGSNLFTFTRGSTAVMYGTRRASLGGLSSRARGLHGISIVELCD